MFNCVYCAHRNSPVCKECIGWNRYQDIRFDIDRELDIIHRETEKKSTTVSMKIKKVVFNDPATIILWEDGTKSVVKCGKRDDYDPEKGLAMAITKKALGNSGNYYNEIRKWLPKEKEPIVEEKNGKDYTVKEYCALHNCTKNKVYRMIMNGEISAVKDSKGHWIVFE